MASPVELLAMAATNGDSDALKRYLSPETLNALNIKGLLYYTT
jgi:hypothetical protein